jgi:hypothetical protein
MEGRTGTWEIINGRKEVATKMWKDMTKQASEENQRIGKERAGVVGEGQGWKS